MNAKLACIAAVGACVLLVEDARASETITLRAGADSVTSEVTRYVAQVGARAAVVPDRRKTFAQLVEDHCGRADDEYLRVAAELITGKDDIAGFAQATVERGETVELPACIKVGSYEVAQRTVHQNEHPWAFYQRDRAGFRSFELAQAHGDTAYLEAFKQLNRKYAAGNPLQPGEDIYVPVSAETWSSLELRPGVQATEAMATLRAITEKMGHSLIFDASDRIDLFYALRPKELAERGACQAPGVATSDEGFDVGEVVALIERARSAGGSRSGSPSVIIVPDTGMHVQDRSPFPKSRLDLKARRLGSMDVYFGITPYLDDPHSQHGTYVATVALGGAKFMAMLDAINLDIQVLPVNLHSSATSACLVDGESRHCHEVLSERFSNAVRLALNTTNPVVNLSVGRNSRFDEIAWQLNSNSNILFVVAAGNEGRPLKERVVYPARHGGSQGDGRDNLITVAALDLDGRLASFSNHGADYVEIAAPGCLQRVLHYDSDADGYREVRASGTSFATPLVSFTAATLRTLWPGATPRQIKRRLLYSADISSKVDSAAVEDGRVLNVANALSLYDDVVVADVGGQERTIRGSLASFTHGDFCGLTLYKDPAPDRDVIKKIARDPTSPGWIIYAEGPEGVVKKRRCSDISLQLTIKEQFTQWTYQLTTEELQDVLFAEKN